MLPVSSEGMPDPDWHRLQRIIAGFETSWKRGDRPRITDVLPDDEPYRDSLLIELVHSELEFRLKAGESARVEDYLRCHPSLARDRETILELIKTEWQFRRRREPQLSLERFRERFPEFRAELDSGRSGPSPTPAPESGRGSKSGASPEPSLPRRLGKYELKEKVGRGSFGVVYRAWDTVLHREVAVKIPRPGSISTLSGLRAFLREARNAIGLNHPNIVAIYDAGPIGDTVCLVRAFIEGSTLSERLREAPFPPRESAALMALVVEALDHAHGQGIIHRDLTPGNILLDLDGQPHVSDFGLARREAGETSLSSVSQAEGFLIGTPTYMSPEQARGEAAKVDARSDVYGAGVILYELLTGTVPFHGRGRMLEIQIQQLEPAPPRSLNDEVPLELEAICLKALAKRPDRRYRSAREMAEDLRGFLVGEPIGPIPKSPPGPGKKAPRTPWAMAGLAALGLGLVGTTWSWFRAESLRRLDGEALAHLYRGAVEALKPASGASARSEGARLRAWDEIRALAPLLDGDPDLKEDAADAYLRLAAREEAEGSDRLAGPHLARASALSEEWLRRHPDQIPRRKDLARALARLAEIRARSGEPDESRRLLDRALGHWARLRDGVQDRLGDQPGSADYLLETIEVDLGIAEVGGLLGGRRDLPEAEKFVDSLEWFSGLVPGHRSRLAGLFLDLSRVQLADRQQAKAVRSAKLGLKLFQGLPWGSDCEKGLARAHLTVARCLHSNGPDRRAREEFQQAADRFGALSKADPIEAEFSRGQADALFELGEDQAAFAQALREQGRAIPSAWTSGLAIWNQARAVALAPGIEGHRRGLEGLVRSILVDISGGPGRTPGP